MNFHLKIHQKEIAEVIMKSLMTQYCSKTLQKVPNHGYIVMTFKRNAQLCEWTYQMRQNQKDQFNQQLNIFLWFLSIIVILYSINFYHKVLQSVVVTFWHEAIHVNSHIYGWTIYENCTIIMHQLTHNRLLNNF